MSKEKQRITIGGVALTAREIKVLQLVAEGLGNKEIAGKLGITTSSLEKILGNTNDSRSLYRKINVQNKPEAAAWWVQHKAELSGEVAQTIPAIEDTTKLDLVLLAGSIAVVVTCYVIIFLGIFIPTFLQDCHDCPQNHWSNVYLFVPFVGGIFGALRLVRKRRFKIWPWGWALSLLCVGSVFWAIGGIVWLWFNVYGDVELPYPSAADYAYAENEVLTCIAVFIVWRHYVGSLRKLVPLLIITLASCLLTIYASLSLRDWRMVPALYDPNKFMFDIYYPTIDTVIVVAFFQVLRVLISNSSAPLLRGSLSLLLAGLVLNYFANITFCLTSTVPPSHPFAFYNGGLSDFTYTTAFFLIGLGIQLMPLIEV